MNKFWFYFLLVAVIAVLIVIHTQIIPHYVLIHSTNDIDGKYLRQLTERLGQSITIKNVDRLYMGWSDLCALLAVVIPILCGSGFVLGILLGLTGKEEELKIELNKILSEQRVSTSGVTIGGYRAEAIEAGLRKECNRLEQERKKLDEEKLSFNQEYSHFVDLRNKTTETAKQLDSLKQSNANRLDKITRLEKASEKLEAKLVELEKENIHLKTENLGLAKKILNFEEKNS